MVHYVNCIGIFEFVSTWLNCGAFTYYQSCIFDYREQQPCSDDFISSLIAQESWLMTFHIKYGINCLNFNRNFPSNATSESFAGHARLLGGRPTGGKFGLARWLVVLGAPAEFLWGRYLVALHRPSGNFSLGPMHTFVDQRMRFYGNFSLGVRFLRGFHIYVEVECEFVRRL